MFGSRARRNIAVVRRFFTVLSSAENTEALDSLRPGLFASEHIHHFPGQNLYGPAGVKQLAMGIRASFPDRTTTIDDIFAAQGQEKVVVRFTIEGTFQGEGMGPQAVGKHVRYTGMDIFRLKGGKIVDRWGEVDEAGILRQLGVILEP
jgi:predicted ester cyclase